MTSNRGRYTELALCAPAACHVKCLGQKDQKSKKWYCNGLNIAAGWPRTSCLDAGGKLHRGGERFECKGNFESRLHEQGRKLLKNYFWPCNFAVVPWSCGSQRDRDIPRLPSPYYREGRCGNRPVQCRWMVEIDIVGRCASVLKVEAWWWRDTFSF